LKQIWEQDVMGLQAPMAVARQHVASPGAVSAADRPTATQRSTYGPSSTVGARKMVSV